MKNQINNLVKIGLVCLAFFSMTTIQAQVIKNTSEKTILVEGNVSDETGPLPGVNIILQGTRIGTATDFNGDFEFPQKLKKGDVLVFSYIGMKSQKVVISDENSASKIELKIGMMLDNVIIVGKVATKKVYTSSRN